MKRSVANDATLIRAAMALRESTRALKFSAPVTHVYRPLEYAWAAHEAYLQRYGAGRKRVMFMGMNPGPFGMVQTGVPFGEVQAVRTWLDIQSRVGKPNPEHPRRPVLGFDCRRSEISGQRLWALFARRFGVPEDFFADHIVVNYCPLAFLELSGRNRTPDRLPVSEQRALFAACDAHLREVCDVIQPEWVVGIGEFAARRAQGLPLPAAIRIGRILHPSPACPESNRGWAQTVTRQLEDLGVWPTPD